MSTTLPVSFKPAYIVHTEKPWDLRSGFINPPKEAPPSLRQLKGYALFADGGKQLDLSTIKEPVLIVDSKETMISFGLMSDGSDKKEKKDRGNTAIGVYQKLPDRFGYAGRIVFLPWVDEDKRRQRSETWKRYWVHAINRAHKVAKGAECSHVWTRLLIGESPAVVAALEAMLGTPQTISIDVETVGDMPDMAITAIGFASDACSVSVPWAGYASKAFGQQPGLQSTRIHDLIKALLASHAHPKAFHNGGFDRAVFAGLGMPCNGEFHDTLLLMKIIFPELYRNLQFSAGMAALFDPWKDEFKRQRKALLAPAKAVLKAAGVKKPLDDWREIPLDALLLYNCKDAAATQVLLRYLLPRLNAAYMGDEKYAKLRQLADISAEMWAYGVPVDQEARNRLLAEGQEELAQLVTEWSELVGPEFPPFGKGSGAGLRKLFFEKLKAPVIARSKKAPFNPSINTFALTCWDTAGRQPLSDIAFLYYRIRKLQKNTQAFLVPLKSDRCYPQHNVTGTVGTRFSCSNPNLQQYNKDHKTTRLLTGEKVKLAPNMRKLIIAEPGHSLIEYDFNALEARANGYRTANTLWFEWMATGKDMHVQHVFMMYGVRLHRKGCGASGCPQGDDYCSSPDSEADWADPDSLRQVTKVVTYNRFYNKKGTSAAAVKMLKSKMPTLTEEMLDEVYARFDAAIPNVHAWHMEASRTDVENGYIRTGVGGWQLPVGRRSDDNRNRSFEIQSTVGAVVCDAMLRLMPYLRERGARLFIQVHDAFVVQCKDEDVPYIAAAMKWAMEYPVPELWDYKNVVFPVDGKFGKSWGNLKPLPPLPVFTPHLEKVG